MMATDDWNPRRSLGGSLRPGDQRRFYIEAMVGAMHADGVVDARELSTLRDMLGRHDLFSGLPESVADMLIAMSTDAIDFAGGAERRVPIIADNLHWRVDRLAAFAMACEMSGADDQVHVREQSYLAALRIALHIGDREHTGLVRAARDGRAMVWLEDEVTRFREQLPAVAELLLLRRWNAGGLTEYEIDDVTGMLLAIRDYGASRQLVRTAIEPIVATSSRWRDIRDLLPALVRKLTWGADYYWAMVYLMVDDLRRDRPAWRENQLICQLGAAFQFSELQMGLASEDAARIARSLRLS